MKKTLYKFGKKLWCVLWLGYNYHPPPLPSRQTSRETGTFVHMNICANLSVMITDTSFTLILHKMYIHECKMYMLLSLGVNFLCITWKKTSKCVQWWDSSPSKVCLGFIRVVPIMEIGSDQKLWYSRWGLLSLVRILSLYKSAIIICKYRHVLNCKGFTL